MAPRVETRQPPASQNLNGTSLSGISRPSGRKKPLLSSSRTSSIAISTNVSFYPRTDPIHALNTLLKLVSSLPGRIGGCQYKLTPAEQSLSLHLVGILEPFVYQGARALGPSLVSGTTSTILGHSLPAPPSISLVQQPTEILDAILFYVDQKKDLLNIGLACKRLHDVVFPRHFDYRVIRCKVSSLTVWNHLMKHRSLARNVRKLEILDERVSASASTTRTSTSSMLIPRGILETDTDLESTDDELTMHSKQERYLILALARMTALNEFKWSCNHSPLSFLNLWSTLAARAGAGLQLIKVSDNMAFSPKLIASADEESESDTSSDDDSDSADEENGPPRSSEKRSASTRKGSAVALPHLRSVTIESTSHTYGAVKQPELGRISGMLNQCINLKELDISYSPPRGSSGVSGAPPPVGNPNLPASNPRTKPIADEFLLYSRWIPTLTHLSLKNLRCMSSVAPSAFLADHSALEVLSLDIVIHHNATTTIGPIHLPAGSLPRLREIRASRDVINAILQCPTETPRPLEAIKGFKLFHQGSGSRAAQVETEFLANLKQASSTIRRIELSGWHDMEEVRRLATSVPNVQHLDIGKRLGGPSGSTTSSAHAKNAAAPATNHMEWAETLGSLLPDLVAFHGVKFFYEVSSGGGGTMNNTPTGRLATDHNTGNSDSFPAGAPNAVPALSGTNNANLSNMERSRMRKNDEIAGVLAWKCKKLRRVDHWEDGTGKVIVLLRDGGHGHVEEGSAKGKGKEREGKFRWEIRRLKM